MSGWRRRDQACSARRKASVSASACGEPISVKALRRLEAEQLTAARELRVEGSEVALNRRHALDRGHREAAEAVVDPVHLRRRCALVIFEHTVVCEYDIGGVPLPVVAQDGHHRAQPAALPGGSRGTVIELQVGVAVEHQEPLPEQRLCPADRSQRAGQLRPVVAVGDRDPELAATDQSLELLPQIADAQDGLPHAMLRQQAQLVQQKRLSRDLEQRLWHLAHPRAQSGPEAAGENADRGRCRHHQASGWKTMWRSTKNIAVDRTATVTR